MHGDRWATLSPLLDELLELTGDARNARIEQIAAADAVLAQDLRKFMTLEAERPDFLSQPITHGQLDLARAGQEVGPYRLVAPIGEGGMGQVWLAVRADGLYERRVALKLLRPGLGDVGLHHIVVNDWDAGVTAEQNVVLVSIASAIDASLAPPGKHCLHAYTPATEPYALWAGLDRRSERYAALKRERSQVLWRAVERAIPDIRDRVRCMAARQLPGSSVPPRALSALLQAAPADARLQ